MLAAHPLKTAGFQSLTWKARAPLMVQRIREQRAEIVCLQEVEDISMLASALPEFCWTCVPEVTPRIGFNAVGLQNGIGFAIEETLSFKLGAEDRWESAILVRCSRGLSVMCVHLSVDATARWTQVNKIGGVLFHEARRPGAKVILAGNFNTFPSADGLQQIPYLASLAGLTSATEGAISCLTKQLATTTFSPFPFDSVDPHALQAPGKLDHILCKGFVPIQSYVDDRPSPSLACGLSNHFLVGTTFAFHEWEPQGWVSVSTETTTGTTDASRDT